MQMIGLLILWLKVLLMGVAMVIGSKYLAVMFAILAALFLSLSAAIVKFIGNTLPLDMILFVRFLFGFIYISIVGVLCSSSKRHVFSLRFTYIKYHIIRAVSGLSAMFLLYHSLKYIPLVDGITLSTTYPLFIPIIMLVIFKVRTSLTVSIFLTAGFMGVILILQPTSHVFTPQSLFALAASVFAAISIIVIRFLNQKCGVYSVLFYYFLMTSIVTGIMSAFNWKPPTALQYGLLLLAGLAGTLFQDFLARALGYASSRVVSPILYFSAVFGVIFDRMFWHNTPNIYCWLGIFFVCASAIMVIILSNRQTSTVPVDIKG